MPMLPCGTHIAADPDPLRELLEGVGSGFNAHRIMSLESADDLLGWLDMLVLDPDDLASSTPVGRLGDWERYADAHGWDAADRAAMRKFVIERVLPSMARIMDTNVQDAQVALLKSVMVAGALARCSREGVHPLQAEPE